MFIGASRFVLAFFPLKQLLYFFCISHAIQFELETVQFIETFDMKCRKKNARDVLFEILNNEKIAPKNWNYFSYILIANP
jgi:hypothetical protein